MVLAHGSGGDELIFTAAFLLLFIFVLLSSFFMSRRDTQDEETNIDDAVRQSLEKPSETNLPPST